MRLAFAALTALVLTLPVPAAVHAASAAPARESKLPPGEDDARAALDRSPRHGEYVSVRVPNGGATIRCWIVYPERKDKAGVVLVIHEIFGLSDWIRGLGDALARDGFIAIVPDLISGFGPGGGGTDSVPNRDDVVKLIRNLTDEETAARLDAVRDYALHLPAANGKLATMGFCWGGARSFAYAAAPQPPEAAVVFYGTSPDSAELEQVRAPVLGLYGGDDARVDATIEPAKRALMRLGRSYEPHLFEGAGHGFLRAQSLRDGANARATRQAWPLAIAFLRKHLK